MTESTGSASRHQRLKSAQEVDQRCDRFEQAWYETTSKARLEDFLNPTVHASHKELLHALILVWLELESSDASFRPDLDNLLRRFPNDHDVVVSAFGDAEAFRADWMIPSEISHYRIVRELGRGSFGRVYLANDIRLQRPVALKVLHRQFAASSEIVRRFQQEAKTVSQFRHPGICTLFDIGQHDDWLFFAMEFIEGRTLAQHLGDQGPLPSAEAVQLMADICDAIAYAHAKNVVHHDLKPSNVMLDTSGRPCVMDFGMSDYQRSDASAASRMTSKESWRGGTPGYAAPGQLSDFDRMPSTTDDIFSLGVILAECLGERVNHNTSDAGPPDDSQPDQRLARIWQRAANPDETKRYQTATELRSELIAWQNQQGTSSKTFPSIPKRLSHFAGLCIAAGIGLLILLAPNRSPVSPERDQAASAVLPFVSPHSKPWLDAPISLDEFLVGKSVLTVSQSGNADYRSLTDAFAALKANSVIEFLDEGPYQESIDIDTLPVGVGIVSQVGTQLDLPDWNSDERTTEMPNLFAWRIGGSFDLRLQGLHWRAPELPKHLAASSHGSPQADVVRLTVSGSKRMRSRLVIDDCSVRWAAVDVPSQAERPGREALHVVAKSDAGPVWLRNSNVDGHVKWSVRGPSQIHRCRIGISEAHGTSLTVAAVKGAVASVNDCVLMGRRGLMLGFRKPERRERNPALQDPYICVHRCLLIGRDGVVVGTAAKSKPRLRIPKMLLSNNLFVTDQTIRFLEAIDADEARDRWELQANGRILHSESARQLAESDPASCKVLLDRANPSFDESEPVASWLPSLRRDSPAWREKYGPTHEAMASDRLVPIPSRLD